MKKKRLSLQTQFVSNEFVKSMTADFGADMICFFDKKTFFRGRVSLISCIGGGWLQVYCQQSSADLRAIARSIKLKLSSGEYCYAE